MPEVVGAFSGKERGYERSDRSVKTGQCSLSRLAELCLEFAERHLDGIEIGRVFGEIAQCRPRLLDRFLDPRNLMGVQIVHHDDVAAPEYRGQALLDVGSEDISGHGAFDDHGADHFVVTQASYERNCFPISERSRADQSDTSWSASSEPDQIGANGGFVDKYQPGRLKHALLLHPTSSGARHVRSLPFCRPQAFFLR